MRLSRFFLTTSLALLAFAKPANAATIQVTADTSGSLTVGAVPGTIKKTAGAATTLTVSSKSNAYINFALNQSGLGFSASSVTAARLVIYFPKITKAGTLTLFANVSGFTETFPTATIPSPLAKAAANGLPGTFQVTAASAKNFRVLTVTNQVKDWLANPSGEFGFGVSSDGTASVLIGSKEGAGSGYPAVLEIDVNPTGGGVLGGSSSVGGVGVGSSVDSSLTLNLVNTATSGTTLEPNLTGIGFGQASTRQAIVGGTFGNDFLDFYTGGALTTPKLRIDFAGNLGIGTTTAGAKLDVRGDIRLGSTGQFLAVGAGENLRLVRGAIGGAIPTPSVDSGTGFTVARTVGKPVGVYRITFATAFGGDVTATATAFNSSVPQIATISDYTSTSIEVSTFGINGSLVDATFTFIATGPK